MLGSPCSPCCSQNCSCGDTRYGYSGQGLSSAGIPGRWCCNGQMPPEITLSFTASAVGGPWVSYQRVSGSWFNGQFYDESRGYYDKRYKRTLTLNVEDLNVDYVLGSHLFFSPNFQGRLCGYAYGGFACPRVYPGSGSVEAVSEQQEYPSYTITMDTCNSNLPGNPPTTGTLRREYEYLPLRYVGFYQFEPAGDWTRDAALDTESTTIPCTYLWSFTGRSVLNEQACDLRTKNLSWSSQVTVNHVVELPNLATENVGGNGSTSVDGTSQLPEFNLTAAILEQ